MKYFIVCVGFIAVLSMPFLVQAQSVQIEVNGVQLNIIGQGNTLYEATIESNGLAISMKGGTSIQVIAPSGRQLSGSPYEYISRSICNDTQSSITMSVPSDIESVDIHIIIGQGYCGSPALSRTPLVSSEINITTGPSANNGENSTNATPLSYQDSALKVLNSLQSSHAVQSVVKNVIRPVSVGAAVVGLGSVATAGVNASANIAVILSHLAQYLGNGYFYLLGLLGIRKRRPWGKVIQEITGNGLAGVTIQIYDAEFKKIKDTQITDAEGRFSGLIVPGSYFIKASKKGFVDVSSETITIASISEVINVELALSPSTRVSGHMRRLVILQKIKNLLQKLNPYLVGTGTLFSVFSFLINSSRFNLILMILYLLLSCIQLYFSAHLLRPFGRVVSASNGIGLSLAVVRVFDKQRDTLLSTHVSDKDGRFGFLLSPGTYYYTVTKTGFEPYSSNPVTLTKAGLANFNIVLQAKS